MSNSSKSSPSENIGTRIGKQIMIIGDNSGTEIRHTSMGKRSGKRPGRKPSKIDERAKLERSRQSARECRARKKLRYQYLEELVLNREKAVFALRDELETYKQWCLQLDNEGRVPESLLKAIVNEEMSQKKKQIEEANKSLLQQQQQQQKSQEIQVSSSTSSSSESPSPPRHELSKHEQAATSLHSQGHLQPSTSSFQFHSYAEGWSPPLHQEPPQDQHYHRSKMKRSTTATSLMRQVAFDQSSDLETFQKFQSNLPTHSMTSQAEYHSPSHDQSSVTLGQFKQKQHQAVQKHLHLIGKEDVQILSTQHPYNIPTSSQFYQKRPVHIKTDVRSDKYKRFQSTGIHSPIHESRGLVQDPKETNRARSFSNPASMAFFPQSRVSATITKIVPSSSHTSRSFLTSGRPSSSQPSESVGLFTGSLIESKTPSSLNIPTSVTIEESSSSDENVNVQQLFQCVSTPQKKALSDSVFLDSQKRTSTVRSMTSPATATLNYEPHAKLRNLTTVRCSSTTGTCNTPSPSSIGVASPGIPSPKANTFKSSSTPTSSSSTSPAPPPTASPHLDFSSGIPFSVFNSPVDSSDYLMSSDQGSEQSNPVTVPGSYASLTPSIDVSIPEVFSLLYNIREGDMSPCTSTHATSSNHSTPTTMTPKPSDQPTSPDPSDVNVPKIIAELLQLSKQNM